MNTSANSSPFSLPETAPDLARRFAVILAGLAGLVARRFLRMPHLSVFTLLLWGRLNRAVRRFYRALTQAPGKARAGRAPKARGARGDDARVRPMALPTGRGWLVRELGWEAAGYMSQLEALLAEVASREALAGAPATGRVLRPICRMLGVSMALTPVVVRRVPAVVVAAAQELAMDGLVAEADGFAKSR
ncbi:MAG: hypothetical protein H7251_19925 [Acetobacteraceae bacterium]|nr:hypothetical protein [Acetobacteraceae bacterium]